MYRRRPSTPIRRSSQPSLPASSSSSAAAAAAHAGGAGRAGESVGGWDIGLDDCRETSDGYEIGGEGRGRPRGGGSLLRGRRRPCNKAGGAWCCCEPVVLLSPGQLTIGAFFLPTLVPWIACRPRSQSLPRTFSVVCVIAICSPFSFFVLLSPDGALSSLCGGRG